MRLSATRVTAAAQGRGLGNQLWDLAGNRPSLDLPFADSKSLVDATTGTNLIDFTRASSGTYVGSDGLIKTATTNLLLRSEEFDNASWSKLRLQAFGSGSVVDATASPVGTLTSEKITEDSTTGFHYVQPLIGSTVVSGATITTSIYAKASERIGIAVFPYSSAAGARFNLSLGTVHSVDAGVTASIQNVGNGWYRCIASITAPGTSATPWFLILNAAFATSYTGDGTSGLFLWGAQLEQSSTVGEYIPTTSTINSAPRFDHNPTTGESLGLLVEEQRTNLCLQSEDFSTTWTSSLCSVTTNTQTAPNGTLTADTLTDQNGSTGSPFALQTLSLADSTTYVMSCFIKAGTKTTARVGIRAKDGTVIIANFDLAAGTTTVGNASSSSIQRFGNGWFRCSAVCASATGATSQRGLVYIDTTSYTADGTGTIHVWGAQLEAGAFPTSYIPTTTATVTRAADVASISGSNYSSWANALQGTLFAEASALGSTGSTQPVAFLTDGSENNRIMLARRGDGFAGLNVNASAVTQADIASSTAFAVSTLNKLAACYATNDFALSANGGSVNTDSLGTVPTLDRLLIGDRVSGSKLFGHIRRLCYWSQRLPNETLQTITN